MVCLGLLGEALAVLVLLAVCELLSYAGDMTALLNYNTGKVLHANQHNPHVHRQLDSYNTYQQKQQQQNQGELCDGEVTEGPADLSERQLPLQAGFEDLAPFVGGQLLTFASNHSYMKFQLGFNFRRSIREIHLRKGIQQETLKTQLFRLSGDGGAKEVQILDLAPDFELFPHGLAAYGTIATETDATAATDVRTEQESQEREYSHP